MQPFLSVIIPAHNEETRLTTSLRQLGLFLSRQDYTSEVVVVENGSQDQTYTVAMEIAGEMPNLRVLHLDEAGKGLAVRTGLLASHGDYRMIADADFSMPVEEINLFLPPNQDADICIASRELTGSVRYNEPALRHFIGRIYNFFIRALVLPGLQDTQCGFKCFRGKIVEDIFSLQTIDGRERRELPLLERPPQPRRPRAEVVHARLGHLHLIELLQSRIVLSELPR